MLVAVCKNHALVRSHYTCFVRTIECRVILAKLSRRQRSGIDAIVYPTTILTAVPVLLSIYKGLEVVRNNLGPFYNKNEYEFYAIEPTLKDYGLPCSYLPTQNRPYPQNCIAFLRLFNFFSFILLTNPSLKSLKAVFQLKKGYRYCFSMHSHLINSLCRPLKVIVG